MIKKTNHNPLPANALSLHELIEKAGINKTADIFGVQVQTVRAMIVKEADGTHEFYAVKLPKKRAVNNHTAYQTWAVSTKVRQIYQGI